MAVDKDWKAKYKATVDELETKEAEWQEIDSLLRKTISRVSIAGRGFDARLDDQLKQIQNLSRDKKDTALADALEKLSRVVASLGDSSAVSTTASNTQEIQKPAADPSALLLALLQEIQFKEDQRAELKSICGDLIKLLGSGKSQGVVKSQIHKLSALINANFGNGASNPKDEDNTSYTTTEVTINEVLTTLLEKLTVIQGAGDSAKLLQNQALDKIDDSDWPEVLNQIVDCIAATLDKLNREKYDLENFIVKVTQQLGKISDVIAADQKDQRSDQEDRHSLQQMMLDSMKSIGDDFDNASEIGQLKNVVVKSLQQIQNGIEGFVTRANQRHESIDERNSHLVAQITAMDQKTRTLKKRLDENREKLLFDTLTGAGSRLSYDETLEQEMARWQRYGEGFSYAILDIDHFKRINDKYGHSAGDKALKIVVKMMMSQIRKSDAIFRIGGEEFVLLLPNTSLDKADSLVNKLRETIASSSIHCKQERVALTLSAGITEPRDDDVVKSLYERADKALYRAKSSGRNCQFIG
ncbi:MAG: GGDEF domain-containing protein [Gammaproteobacteria bacterium]|nr:GGDEF domain-containing protein [Gammaproteobacteria bacterium]